MLKAMTAEMPKRHWHALPETREIPSLIAEAGRRVDAMLSAPQEEVQGPTAHQLAVESGDLGDLATRLARCQGCELHGRATAAVPGSGASNAPIVLVGEQPGDLEDRSGRPFVGPAGQVLAAAMKRAGLRDHQVYVTNAVKHFSYAPEGKRRLHSKPRSSHVRACRPWLLAELERIRPRVVVCLGTTAARALLGVEVRVARDRGNATPSPWAPNVLVTYHPAAILRTEDRGKSEALRADLVADLREATRLAFREERSPGPG